MIGPVVGGFIAQSIGSKWVFIIIACLCGVASAIAIPLLSETYAPVIRMRKAKRSQDPEKATPPVFSEDQGNRFRYLWLNISRPAMLLTRSFVCFILSLYMALLVSLLFLVFETYERKYSMYG